MPPWDALNCKVFPDFDIIMNKNIFKALGLFFLILLTFIMGGQISYSNNLFATWVREKGRTLVYTDISYRSADEYYTNGRRMDSNRFQGIDWSLYVDHGITETYTLGFYMPLVKVLSIDETTASPSVTHINRGDLDIIQRLQFASLYGTVINAELLIGVPTGNPSEPHGLHTGDGEFNFQPGLSMGKGFGFFSLPSYITLHSGINIRSRGFSHEWHTGFQWGVFIYKESLLVSLEIKKLQSLKNNAEIFIGDDGLWNNTSYVAYGLGLTYKPNPNFGISTYYKTLGELENSLGGDIYSLAIFYLF